MKLDLNYIHFAYLECPVYISYGFIYVSIDGLGMEITNSWFTRAKTDVRLVRLL